MQDRQGKTPRLGDVVMIEIAHALSSFLPNGQIAPVSPVDQPVYILTSDQLRAIISDAVHKATKSILTALSDLEARINALEARSTVIEAHEEADIIHLANGQAEDRKRISALEHQSRIQPTTPLGEKTVARIDQIKSILKSRGPTSFGELERILKISPREMLRITKKLDLRYFEITRRPGDARQKVLRLRSQIG